MKSYNDGICVHCGFVPDVVAYGGIVDKQRIISCDDKLACTLRQAYREPPECIMSELTISILSEMRWRHRVRWTRESLLPESGRMDMVQLRFEPFHVVISSTKSEVEVYSYSRKYTKVFKMTSPGVFKSIMNYLVECRDNP